MKHAEIDEVGWRSHVPKRIRRLVRKYRTYFISQLRAGRARVKGAFVPTIIAAAFAAVSWTICKYLMGEPGVRADCHIPLLGHEPQPKYPQGG